MRRGHRRSAVARRADRAGILGGDRARRLLEHTPLAVPLGAAVAVAGLGIGAHLGVVSDTLAWTLGAPLFLGVEVFILYALIAWQHARRRRG